VAGGNIPRPSGRRQVLLAQERIGAEAMRKVILKARNRMERKIVAAVRDQRFASAATLRDTLYSDLRKEYIRFGGELDDFTSSRVSATAKEWRRMAIDDLPPGQYNQRWKQFSRKYVDDMTRIVSPKTGKHIAAVNGRLGGMLEQDIRTLRKAVIDVNRQAALTGMTAREIQKEVMGTVLAKSNTWAFIDQSGRKWKAGNYFNMQNRTLHATVARETTVNVMNEAGVDLAIIEGGVVGDSHPGCVAWAGRIVSVSGTSTEYPSLDDAIADGLYHPNCRHYLAYVSASTDALKKQAEDKSANRIATKQEQLRRIEADKIKPPVTPPVKPPVTPPIAPPTPGAFVPAKTIGEAEEWAKRKGIAKDIDYSGIDDVDVANKINKTLSDLVDEYGVTLDGVGMTDLPVDILGNRTPAQVFRFTINDKQKVFMNLDLETWKNKASLKSASQSVQAGWLESPTSGGMLTHEYAHALEFAHKADKARIASIYNKWMEQEKAGRAGGVLSGYGHANATEMTAEAFVLYAKQGAEGLRAVGLGDMVKVFDGWRRGAKVARKVPVTPLRPRSTPKPTPTPGRKKAGPRTEEQWKTEATDLRKELEKATPTAAEKAALRDAELKHSKVLSETDKGHDELRKQIGKIHSKADPAYKAFNKEWNRLNALRVKSLRAKEAAKHGIHRRARGLIYQDTPGTSKAGGVSPSIVNNKVRNAQLNEARDSFNRMIGAGTELDDVKINATTKRGRAYHVEGRGIYYSASDDIGIIIHEMSHALEYASPRVHREAVAFLNRRKKPGEKLRRLKDLKPGSSYKAHEVCFPDEFKNPYTGKIYGSTASPSSTEIVSMGVEAMYRNPLKFAKDDPDFFDFIYRLLRDR